MSYQVLIRSSAEKEMDALPHAAHARISAKIAGLALNPRPSGCKKLTGVDGYRIRVGDYRIIYTIDDKIVLVTVVGVGHRREVYR